MSVTHVLFFGIFVHKGYERRALFTNCGQKQMYDLNSFNLLAQYGLLTLHLLPLSSFSPILFPLPPPPRYPFLSPGRFSPKFYNLNNYHYISLKPMQLSGHWLLVRVCFGAGWNVSKLCGKEITPLALNTGGSCHGEAALIRPNL